MMLFPSVAELSSRVGALLTAMLFVCVLADAGNPTGIRRSAITLKRNGYEGVLVAISERVPETHADKLIARIKQYFSDTSFYLFEATNRRAYIRNITILVPKSWSNNNSKYEPAPGEFFENANIIIDEPNPMVGESPYVKRSTSCGQDGDYMHITPSFMLKSLFEIYKDYGYPGPTLAHEWGHLRWGLFDEYALPKIGFPKFYFDSSGKVAATKCGKYMRGSIVIPGTAIPCPIVPSTGLPDHRCVFIADSGNIAVNASVMFYHFLPAITAFCDNDESNTMTMHNSEAPNAQNDFCNGQSAWQVMRAHRDFVSGNNPPIPASQPVDTTPIYRIAQAQTMRVVVILDVSGSMSGTKLSKLRQATADYILNMVPDSAEVGLVKFSNRAKTLCQLTTIHSAVHRAELVRKIPKKIEGGTGIGGALLVGVKMLERFNADPAGGILLVVTDGEENRSPFIDTVRPELLQKRIVLNAVLITKSGENRLIALAKALNGVSNFDTGDEQSTALTSAFRATLTADRSWAKPGKKRVELLSIAISIGVSETKQINVFVDASVGRETEWRFTYPYSRRKCPFNVTLESPSGSVFTSRGSYAVDRDVFQELALKLPNISETGRWIARIHNAVSTAIVSRVIVTSMPPEDDLYPVDARAYIHQQMINFYNDLNPLPVLVKAEVSKGYVPITGAYVEMRAGNAQWQRMRDDGVGADDISNDGVYSGYLWKISSNGKQQVMVRVDGRTWTKPISSDATAAAFPRVLLEKNESIGIPLDENKTSRFQRTAAAGLVNITGWTPDLDLKQYRTWSPGRVNTLELVAVFVSNWTVVLRWFDVEDPDEEYTVPKYILRYSKEVRSLREEFDGCSKVQRNDLLNGNFANPSRGLTIRFPVSHRNRTLFFGVKVQRGTRTSRLSNIVSASFVSLISQRKSAKKDTGNTKSTVSADAMATVPQHRNASTSVVDSNTAGSVHFDNSNSTRTTAQSTPHESGSSRNKLLLVKICVGVGLGLMSLAAVVVAVIFRSYNASHRHSSVRGRHNRRIDPQETRAKS